MRHYAKDKVLGPAKPMWFCCGDGFLMEPNKFYLIVG